MKVIDAFKDILVTFGDKIHTIFKYIGEMTQKRLRSTKAKEILPPDDGVKVVLPEDIFRRTQIAERMCDVICTSDAKIISPVVINGPWGCGKTVHAQRMIKILSSPKYVSSHKCVYWNAAISDYAEHPLPHFVALLYKFIKDSQQKDFQGAALELCGNLAPAIAKSLAIGIISNKFGVDVDKVMRDYTALKELRENNSEFHKALELSQEACNEASRVRAARKLLDFVRDDKELVIIIDELDRCRPTFALELLETIKYLFDYDKCKFVFIMNSKLLVSSISKMYGLNDNDAEHYLNKYVKINFVLPDSYRALESERLCNVVFFYDLLKSNDNEIQIHDNSLIEDFVKTISLNDGLQLRDIEKLVNTIKFIQKATPAKFDYKTNDFFSFIVCFASYLFAFKKSLLNDFDDLKCDGEYLLTAVGYGIDASSHHKNARDFLEEVLNAYSTAVRENQAVCMEHRLGLPISNHQELISQSVSFMRRWIKASQFISM